MSDAQKLTKKQRKGLAFRQRGKVKNSEQETPGGDIPVLENPDEDSAPEHHANTNDQPAPSPPTVEKQKAEDRGKTSTKRKRADDAVHAPSPKKKKAKESADEVINEDDDEDSTPKETQNTAKIQKKRFILFVGNLKYTTSKEAISKHFSACDPPPDVRLLTPKSATPNKSKGCAFLEFTHGNALQQALKLHQSELEGRKINVELTAGGGGKSDQRINKLQSKNRELAAQRTKRAQKERKAEGDSGDIEEDRPQRYSSTSGLQQAESRRKTWTIPEEGDDGAKHRGGKKHAKGEKKRGNRPRPLGTGVNAIPVG